MPPKHFNKYRKGETNIDGDSSSARYDEKSPLFRVDGPREVKQSPMFADESTSKYGSAGRATNDDSREYNPRMRLSVSAASLRMPAVSFRRNGSQTASVTSSAVQPVDKFICDNIQIGHESLREAVQDEGFILPESITPAIVAPILRNRQPPQTRLESLGSTHTWILLLLPAISAVIVLFLHPYCVSTTEFSAGSCEEPFHCSQFVAHTSDDTGDVPSVLRILLRRPVASVSFIDATMHIDTSTIPTVIIISSGRRLEAISNTSDVYAVDTRLFTVSADYVRNLSGENSRRSDVIENTLNALTIDPTSIVSEGRTFYEYVSSPSAGVTLLDRKSLSRPGYLYGGNRYPILDITMIQMTGPLSSISNSESELELESESDSELNIITQLDEDWNRKSNSDEGKKEFRKNKFESESESEDSLIAYSATSSIISQNRENHDSEILTKEVSVDDNIISINNVRLKISSESEFFSIWRAVFIVFLSMISLISLGISMQRVYFHILISMKNENEMENQNIHENKIEKMKRKKYLHFAYYLLPEQISGFALIIVLIFWLCPLSSVLTLLSIFDRIIFVSDFWIFFSKVTESLGRQGLLFVLLCIVDGLKYPQVRKTRISDLQDSIAYASNARLQNQNYTGNSSSPTGESINSVKKSSLVTNENCILRENETYPQMKNIVFQNGIVTKGFVPLQFEPEFSPREKYGSILKNNEKIPNFHSPSRGGDNNSMNKKHELYKTVNKYNEIGENVKVDSTVFVSTNPFDSPRKDSEIKYVDDINAMKCNLNDDNKLDVNSVNNTESGQNVGCIDQYSLKFRDDGTCDDIKNCRIIPEVPLGGIVSRSNENTLSLFSSPDTIKEITDDHENENNENNENKKDEKKEKKEKKMDEIDDLGSKIPRKIPVSRNPTMESELAKHHPLSPYFFEIVGQKILFLFFSSSCVIFFWILQFPQLFTLPFGDALKINGSACYTTERVLRKVKYRVSRFHRMFFRFLTAQLSVGLTAVVVFLLIKLHQLLAPLVESENVEYGFDFTNYGFQNGEKNLDRNYGYLRGSSDTARYFNGSTLSYSHSSYAHSVPYSSSSSSYSYSGENKLVHGYTTEQRWELWVNRWNLLTGFFGGFEADPLVYWAFRGAHLAIPAFVTALCCTTAYILLPPKSMNGGIRCQFPCFLFGFIRNCFGFKSSADILKRDLYGSTVASQDDISAVIDLEGTSHAFVALERDMKYNNETTQNNTSDKNYKNKFSIIEAIKNVHNKKREKRVKEIFCLETACTLMEVSYQAYFPLPTVFSLKKEENTVESDRIVAMKESGEDSMKTNLELDANKEIQIVLQTDNTPAECNIKSSTSESLPLSLPLPSSPSTNPMTSVITLPLSSSSPPPSSSPSSSPPSSSSLLPPYQPVTTPTFSLQGADIPSYPTTSTSTSISNIQQEKDHYIELIPLQLASNIENVASKTSSPILNNEDNRSIETQNQNGIVNQNIGDSKVPGSDAESRVLGPKMDLPRIGLTLLSSFENKEQATFGVVATKACPPSLAPLQDFIASHDWSLSGQILPFSTGQINSNLNKCANTLGNVDVYNKKMDGASKRDDGINGSTDINNDNSNLADDSDEKKAEENGSKNNSNNSKNNSNNNTTNKDKIATSVTPYIGDRIVVTFRGSILANLQTDLRFSQVSVPCLKRRRKFFINMIREFENEKYENMKSEEIKKYKNEVKNENTNCNSDDFNESIKLIRSDVKDPNSKSSKNDDDEDDNNFKIEITSAKYDECNTKTESNTDFTDEYHGYNKDTTRSISPLLITKSLPQQRTTASNDYPHTIQYHTNYPTPLWDSSECPHTPVSPLLDSGPFDSVNSKLRTHLSPLAETYARTTHLVQTLDTQEMPDLSTSASQSHSHIQTFSHCHSLSYSPSLSPLRSHTFSHTLPHTLSPSQTFSHTLPHTLSPSQTFSHTLPHTLSPSQPSHEEENDTHADPSANVINCATHVRTDITQNFMELELNSGYDYLLPQIEIENENHTIDIGSFASTVRYRKRNDSETPSYLGLDRDRDRDLDSSPGSSYMDLEAYVRRDLDGDNESDLFDFERGRDRGGGRGRERSNHGVVYDNQIPELDPRSTVRRSDGWEKQKKEERDDNNESEKEKKMPENSWFSCFRNVLSSLPVFQHTLPRVHEGFWGAYSSVRTDVLRSIVRAFCDHKKQHLQIIEILTLYDDNVSGKYVRDNLVLTPQQVRTIEKEISRPLRVYFCGHSLGAALTVLAALDLSVNLNYILDAIELIYGGNNDVCTRSAYVGIKNYNSHERKHEMSNAKDCEHEARRYDVLPSHSKDQYDDSATTHTTNDPSDKFQAEAEAANSRNRVGRSNKSYKSDRLSILKENASNKWEVPTIAVYTYGAPRIGNTVFAAFVNRKIPSNYRVEVDSDIVTMIPQVLGLYRHAGIPVVVDADEAGSIIVKPTIVESQLLRISASQGSLSSHLLSKYRASLEACFEEEELKEYAKKEHSYAAQSQKEYSIRNPRGRMRSTYAYEHDNDVSLSRLPEWLTEGRGKVNRSVPINGSNSYEHFRSHENGQEPYSQYGMKNENNSKNLPHSTGWWRSKENEKLNYKKKNGWQNISFIGENEKESERNKKDLNWWQ